MEARDLLELKKKIRQAEQEKAELMGQSSQLKQTLQDYGCSNIEEASDKLQILREQIKKEQSELDNGLEELENSYEWS